MVLLLIAALPTPVEALAGLAVFAPMSVVWIAACTGLSPGCSPGGGSSLSTARC